MGPDTLRADGMMRDATEEEVLEEAHILQAEEGDLVLGLYSGGLVSAAKARLTVKWCYSHT